MKKMKIYLDNGATTRVDPLVLEAMLPYFTEKFGNPSSLHSLGLEAKKAVEHARKAIAKEINAEPEEIVFTSGGTESDNLAIKGVAFAKKQGHIITSSIEHPAVLGTCNELQRQGFEITYLDVDKDGIIDLGQLKKAISKKTILVTIMHANNEIGTIQPIEEIGKICAEKNVLFHTDAVQSFTKVPIDVKKSKISMASFSAHKIHGQKGIGALYVKKGVFIEKTIHGGPQESKLRPGTENVPAIVGFGKAVELCKKEDIKKMAKLRDDLIKGVFEKIPDTKLNGSLKKRLCNNANFSFKYVEGESILSYLDVGGISASTGSACSSKSLKPSHVLLALGLTPVEAHGSLRLTLSRFTTEKEIDYVLGVLPGIIKKLRKMSPLTEVQK